MAVDASIGSLSGNIPTIFKNLPAAPVAEKKPLQATHHGITRDDDYAWMQAENWPSVLRDPSSLAPKIRSHLEVENGYSEAAMADTHELQNTLLDEMLGRIKRNNSSVPMKDGPFAYGSYDINGADYPCYFRDEAIGDETIRHILLDYNKEAEGKAYFQTASFNHSSDHAFGLWGYDDKGSEYFRLKIRELSTGRDLDDVIENTSGRGVWAPDGKSFLYAMKNKNNRPSKIFHHVVGTPQAQDHLVYEESDEGFYVSVRRSLLNNFVYIDITDNRTRECRIISTKDLTGEPKLLTPRLMGLNYSLTGSKDVFYILTNADGAKDYKIMKAPVKAPEYENWREVVPHRPGTVINSSMTYVQHLVWLQCCNGQPEIVVLNRHTGIQDTIAFSEEAYSLTLFGAAEYDTDVIRFSYSSPNTPSQLFDYNMQTREKTLLQCREIPSGHDPQDYIVRRVFAPTAPDCPKVAITLLYRENTPLDGSAACLLVGYGAYGDTIPADFCADNLSLVNRGFIIAIAHTRGDAYNGCQSHEDGKMENKPNTFNDFIAAADYLNEEKFTSYANIIAQGFSAGGMIMGAIANKAPEKFNAIIAIAPFVDVLGSLLDETRPITPFGWREWGNPIVSAKFYEIIADYSPYDNVDAKPYPTILALGGVTDARVPYWEPTKWVAKLREKTTGCKPILLKTDMAAGHGGATGLLQRLKERAFIYAFAIKVCGKM